MYHITVDVWQCVRRVPRVCRNINIMLQSRFKVLSHISQECPCHIPVVQIEDGLEWAKSDEGATVGPSQNSMRIFSELVTLFGSIGMTLNVTELK